ncbi:MAG: efflux RND transporter periplasmic adaptor subunit [Chromatiaceae bacterium]|nr:efflux RND transporter periplasmic adaptor subunit [Candidatus Thioaporhodococcus sediminis]
MTFRRRTLVLFILAAAGLGAWWYLHEPAPVRVKVLAVAPGTVEEIVANTRAGTLKPCRRAKLAPSLGGQIATLAVREGDRVKTGDLLLELWNQDLTAQVTLAEREAEAAEARARSACLNAENAEREAARQVKLDARRLTSQETLDRAITAAQAGRADCEAAQATARVSAAKVGVAQANLAKTRLTAPFAGIVAEVSGELSEYVTPSPPGIPTPPAVDLIDDACHYISAPIDEVDAAKVRLGAEVRVTLDAFGDRVFPGRVRRLAPYVLDLEKQARTLEVEVELTDPAPELAWLAGYSADVEIVIERREAVPRVPTAALKPDGTLLVLDPATGRLQARKVQTGLANWEQTQITGGLETGELVVLSLDQEGVKDGALAVREDAKQAESRP